MRGAEFVRGAPLRLGEEGGGGGGGGGGICKLAKAPLRLNLRIPGARFSKLPITFWARELF